MTVWILFSYGRPEVAGGSTPIGVGIIGVYGSQASAEQAFEAMIKVHPDATYSVDEWKVES